MCLDVLWCDGGPHQEREDPVGRVLEELLVETVLFGLRQEEVVDGIAHQRRHLSEYGALVSEGSHHAEPISDRGAVHEEVGAVGAEVITYRLAVEVSGCKVVA